MTSTSSSKHLGVKCYSWFPSSLGGFDANTPEINRWAILEVMVVDVTHLKGKGGMSGRYCAKSGPEAGDLASKTCVLSVCVPLSAAPEIAVL